MKLSAAPRILLVAAACAAALVGFVINEGLARANGQEVTLPIQGVDPRDFLSGHYVRLDFSQPLPAGVQCPVSQTDWDWLALRANGDVYTLVGGAASREEAEQVGPVPVKGTFSCTSPTLAQEGGAAGAAGLLHLNLGIDRFYVDQAGAQRIERVLREQAADHDGRAFAIVSVSHDGRARLKALVIDGQRLDLNWF
jgi:hypothetical protein